MKGLPLLQQAFLVAMEYENVLTVVQAKAKGSLVTIL
jgi:hypothetical protein